MDITAEAIHQRDVKEARERGILIGDVRTLKWAATFIAIAILTFLGFTYQEVTNVRDDLDRVEVNMTQLQINMNQLRVDMDLWRTSPDKRLGAIERKLGLP